MDEDKLKTEDSLHPREALADRKPDPERVYLYKDAGIQVRTGTIPLWLKIVAIALMIWGIYYTIRYWNTP